jgi:alanine racemase
MNPQARLTIDLSVLKRNYMKLQAHVGAACAVAGVVKANAYGLGVENIMPALEEVGCPIYFTATPREALEVRALTDKHVAALNVIMEEETCKVFTDNNIMPVLNTIEDITIWHDWCVREGVMPPAFLQFDTGMRRVGLSYDDVKYLSEKTELLQSLNIYALMSHFASADDTKSALNQKQGDLFKEMLSLLPQDMVSKAKKCLCNSAGTALNSDYHYDIVRPGKSVFGLQAIENFEDAPLFESPVTLEARVLQILDVKKGDTIGYNETFTAEEDMRIATISMGYADGVRRHLSGKGHFLFNGEKLPIRGRVSMDMTMVQIDHLGERAPKRGDYVAFLNKQQTPDDIAKIVGTNGYEILTGLGKRAQRLYIETGNKIKHVPFQEEEVQDIAPSIRGAA